MTVSSIITRPIVGVDPGNGGGLTFIDPTTMEITCMRMPVINLVKNGKNKEFPNLPAIAALFRQAGLRKAHFVVEEVWAMTPEGRTQGATSMFNFGKGYGAILGMVALMGSTLQNPTPSVWKKEMGVNASKEGSRALASQVMPAAAKFWPFKKDEGVAESALIALWSISDKTLRYQFAGNLKPVITPFTAPAELQAA